MKPYEFTADPHQNAVRAFHGLQAAIQTAMPGIIQSFNAVAMTCVVQPSIKAIAFAQDGTSTDVALPLLVDCPVFFPAGGGCTLTFPIKPGDECLVVFSSRCMDAWWYSGGIQVQAEMRMHDLSDGFVFAGVRSQPRALSAVSTSTTQLRSDDGAAYVSINPTSHEIDAITSGNIVANATGSISATAGTNVNITATGNVTVIAANATVTASVSAIIAAPSIVLKNLGTSLKKLCTDTFLTLYNSHTHNDPQGGASSAPNQQATVGIHTTNTVQAE